MELEDSTNIGGFPRKHMNGKFLKFWMKEAFIAVLSYSTHCMVLVDVEADRNFKERWKWGFQSLFLKKWHSKFYSNSSHMDYYPI